MALRSRCCFPWPDVARQETVSVSSAATSLATRRQRFFFPTSCRLLLGDFLALLARFGEPDGDRLLAALHRATFAAFAAFELALFLTIALPVPHLCRRCGCILPSHSPLKGFPHERMSDKMSSACEAGSSLIWFLPCGVPPGMEVMRSAKFAQRMVTAQLAHRGVHDPRVLDAMGSVPREAFVGARWKHSPIRTIRCRSAKARPSPSPISWRPWPRPRN